MKLTLTCDCGNVETITINQKRMKEYCETVDSMYIDDFEKQDKRFTFIQTNPESATLVCSSCSKKIEIS